MAVPSYSAGGNNSGSGTSRVITFTAVAGTFAVLFLGSSSAVTVDAVSDGHNTWTRKAQKTSAPAWSIWSAPMTYSGSITVEVELSASVSASSYIVAYTDADAIAQVAEATGTGTAPAGGSITTVVPDAAIVAVCGLTTDAQTITNPGGYTTRQSTGNVKGRASDNLVSGTGTYAPAYSITASVVWEAATIAVQYLSRTGTGAAALSPLGCSGRGYTPGAPTFGTSGNNSGGGTSRAITWTPLAGTFAVFVLLSESAVAVNTLADTGGNTWTKYAEKTSAQAWSIWFAPITSTGSIVLTATLSASVNSAAYASAYAGVDAITQAAEATGTGTAPGGGSVTTVIPDAAFLAVAADSTNDQTITNPGGYTTRQSTGNVDGRLSDKLASGTGTENPVYTFSVSGAWQAATIAVQFRTRWGHGGAAVSSLGCSGTGALGFSGSASAASSSAGASGTGAQVFAGSGTAAAATLGAGGAGGQVFAATGSAALSPPDCAGVGETGIKGDGSAALSPLGADAAGGQTFTGSASAAVAALGCSGTGGQTFTASAASALSALAAAGSGALAFAGAGAIALASLGADGTGAQAFDGAAQADLAQLQAAGDGAQVFDGSGQVDLASLAAAGVGTYTAPVIDGSGAAALSPPGGEGVGSIEMHGTGAATISGLGADGAGGETFAGAGAAAASSTAAAGVGSLDFAGSGACTAASLATSGQGDLAFDGDGLGALGSLQADGIGTYTPIPAYGDGAAALQPFAGAGVGTYTPLAIAGVGAVDLGQLDPAGAGLVGVLGDGTAGTSPPGADGTGAQVFAGAGAAQLQLDAAGLGLVGVLGAGQAAINPPEAWALGSYTPLAIAGVGLVDLGALQAAGLGVYVPASVTGSGAAALVALELGGAGEEFYFAATPGQRIFRVPAALRRWIADLLAKREFDVPARRRVFRPEPEREGGVSMRLLGTGDQGEGEDLDYVIDWSDLLEDGESIAASSTSTDGPGELGTGAKAPSFTTSETKFWIHGVDPGTDSIVTVQITTTMERVYVRTIAVRG